MSRKWVPNPHPSPGAPPLSAEPPAEQDAPVPPAAGAPLGAGVPAWLLSCTFHLLGIVALGLLLQTPQRGTRAETDREVGIVLVQQTTRRTAYLTQEEAASSGAPQATSASDDGLSNALAAALPSRDQPPVDLAGQLPSASEPPAAPAPAGLVASAGDLAAGGRGTGRGRDWSGYGTRTRVFGVEGEGSRFVYVFDRSGSMEGFQGRPLRAAKAELLRSLQDLGSTHQFQIIFYNERPSVFNPHHPQSARMLFGDERHKRLADRFVQGIVGSGGTRHLEALKLALQLRPDVIFFLTDAAEPPLSRRQLDDIRRLNGRVGASIHAIEFGPGVYQGGANFLVTLARENNGQHTYVDLTRLPAVP